MFCLITGSSRGLGSAVALAFGRNGHHVAVHYKDREDEAEKVASRIEKSIILKADVRDFEEVRRLVDDVIKKWGRIDLLVNNAGIAKEALLLKTSDEVFDEVVAVNLKGPFNLTRAVSRHMMKQKQGHIINVGSIAGIRGKAGLSAYSSSKAGLVGLTRSSAVELARYNVMVNIVLPGYMLTEMGMSSGIKARESALAESLLNKYSEPEEVAEFIRYLAGTKGITGQVFNLDSRII